jgi:prepilin-type N-terminal cleavage/methylation domain-containing protein
MTLIEVLIALSILAMTMAGVYATLMQSRRMTEGSIAGGTALTIVEGYMEQMKNMELNQMVGGSDALGNPQLASGSFVVPTLLNQSLPDPVTISTGTPPALSTITPGVTPAGIQDNLKSYSVDAGTGATNLFGAGSVSTTTQVPWTTVWPGALNYANAESDGVANSTNTGLNDLHLNLWVWVTDLSGTTAQATKVYGVTIIYTWQFTNGGQTQYYNGEVRTIRSNVPTF